jgi:CRP-like cAMP-binding protein
MKLKRSKRNFFDLQEFLATEGAKRKLHELRRGERIFSQGDAAESIICVRKGGVKLSVANGAGKQAVVAMYGPGDFLGADCMAGLPIRMGTATAMTAATILAIGKKEMLRVLHNEPRLSGHFTEYMLGRNTRMEADLVDHLFNPCEKRLARTLLLLADYGKQGQADPILPKVSQKTLAQMIGTTRSRVNFFMNKFRKLGFIECNGKITIKKNLATVTSHE